MHVGVWRSSPLSATPQDSSAVCTHDCHGLQESWCGSEGREFCTFKLMACVEYVRFLYALFRPWCSSKVNKRPDYLEIAKAKLFTA
jgi:hypothetical protein